MRTALQLLVLLATPLAAQTLSEDFSAYRDGDDGSPAWESWSISFATTGGACVGDGGMSVWRAVPFAAAMRLSCDVTVLEVTGREDAWHTAGIGLYQDDRNYWGLHLVQEPATAGERRFTELQEAVEGRWLAQSEDPTRLTSTGIAGQDFAWQVGTTYRMEITLATDRIEGRILEGEAERAHAGYLFDAGVPATRAGRPQLRASGLLARFDNVQVEVTQVATEPEATRAVPEWESRDAEPIAEPTGFFGAAQVDGRWWLVDPEGKAFFAVGTDHCNYNVHWCEDLGYAPYHRNMVAKYGSEDAWAASAVERLKAWNFNTLAANQSPSTRHRGLPHILFASFGSSFAREDWICEQVHWTGFPNVFSPQWERHCRLVARQIARESLGDPWVLGIFLDNELEWYGKRGYLVDEVFQRPADHSAKRALLGWLLERYTSIEGINTALGTRHADEEAFLADVNVPRPSAGLDAVREGFLAVIAEEYFRVAADAMREADPGHLIMGCRFAGIAPESVLEAAGRHNDVFTINTYPRVDMDAGRVHDVPQMLCDLYDVVQRPMIITEWSFPALDSGLPCKHGAGMRVDTQEQKARCYEVFANMVIDLPFMVGYHYFMWVDEPELGIASTFPEDSNYGLVDVNDEPYETLVTLATEVNGAAADRHAQSVRSGYLAVEKSDNGLVVSNPGPIGARATLVLVADNVASEELALGPGESVRRRLPRNMRAAILRQWDGSTQEERFAVSARPRREVAVTNTGDRPVSPAPFVLDTSPPVVLSIDAIRPGQTRRMNVAPDRLVQDHTVMPFAVTHGSTTWRSDGQGPEVFDAVEVDGLELGSVTFAVHQVIEGQHQWVRAERLEEVRASTQGDQMILDMVFTRSVDLPAITAVDDTGAQEAAAARPGAFRAAVRAVLFQRPEVALVRPLWVENVGTRPYELVDVFLFLDPNIGGDSEGDVVGNSGVPNYYLGPAGIWTDETLGGAFGAAGRPDGWRANFWVDEGGMRHPDAYYPVGVPLEPGGTWRDPTMPYLWVFGVRDADGWRGVVRLCLEAGNVR